MAQMIFVNLPVSDLAASHRFAEAMGAHNEPKFTDDTAACMVFSDSVFLMLLTHDKYRQFTDIPIADLKKNSAGIFCLSRDSREAVDATIEAGVAAGGTADPGPKQDYGFMYGRSLLNPDGNHFEFMWMDPDFAEKGAHPVEAAEA